MTCRCFRSESLRCLLVSFQPSALSSLGLNLREVWTGNVYPPRARSGGGRCLLLRVLQRRHPGLFQSGQYTMATPYSSAQTFYIHFTYSLPSWSAFQLFRLLSFNAERGRYIRYLYIPSIHTCIQTSIMIYMYVIGLYVHFRLCRMLTHAILCIYIHVCFMHYFIWLSAFLYIIIKQFLWYTLMSGARS